MLLSYDLENPYGSHYLLAGIYMSLVDRAIMSREYIFCLTTILNMIDCTFSKGCI